MPTVSVVIPTYKSTYIREAVASVLSQTSTSWEIIVVDSSPETTRECLGGHLEKLVYLYQPPQGVAAARNAGIAAAKGDLVAFLDADDLWLPNKLEIQVKALARFPEAGFCFSPVWNLGSGETPGIPTDPYYPPPLVQWFQRRADGEGAAFGSVYELLLKVNCVATSSVIARREALQHVGGLDEALKHAGDDYDLWLRLAQCYPALVTQDPTSRYRVHDAGLSGPWGERRRLFYGLNAIEVLEKHLAEYPSLPLRKALARTYTHYAMVLLEAGRSREGRAAALRSLRVLPTGAAVRTCFEAVLPGFSRRLLSRMVRRISEVFHAG